MLRTCVIISLFGLINIIKDVEGQGRVAPGVPPQHYQHQPPQYQQQQYQQPPAQNIPQHQQINQQQQQQQRLNQQQQMHQPQHVPQQQQQHIPQHHEVPNQQHPQGGHGHHQQGQLLNAANMQHEKEHIAEHLEVPMDTSKMTDQELQFHYFKMHDADNNNKLDGCELIKSLIHWHEQGSKEPQNTNKVEDKIFIDDELITLIDPILSMDDSNRDGYIDYPEFVRAQQKAAAASAPHK